MAPKTPKYLIQKFPQLNLGRIFLHTDALAKRPDMSAYDGPVPATMQVQLDTDTQPVSQQPMTGASVTSEQPVSAVPVENAQGSEVAAVSEEDGDKGEDGTDGQNMTPVLTPEEKHAKLVQAISTLNPDDSAHFTDAGMPRVDVLMAALGMDVEGKEREAAWKAFQETKKK